VIVLLSQVATLIQENRGPRSATASRSAPPLRVALRALGFATFGLTAATLGLVVVPLARLAARWRGRPEQQALRAQKAIHRGMRLWVRWMSRCDVLRVTVRGGEALRGPVVIVANHPSLIDTPILLSVMPQADLIVNAAWGDNPVLRGCVQGGEYLRVEHGAVMVRHAIERLHAGRSLVVYPEGSRTPIEGLRPFERGAAQIALLAGCDILPVVITVRPRTLMKGQGFADVPVSCPEWAVEVGQPIRPADHVLAGESMSAAARRVTAVLQDHFEKRWDRGIC
jgi:1-acyl-sn-glycerol-3-phosphate acyltransferase